VPLLFSTRQLFFSRHVAVSGVRWAADGFPKAYDHKYLSDHRLDRFDHRLNRFDYRLSKRCSALGCINTLADWSTFNSAAGTVGNSHPHSRACIESNTHSYADSEPDTITEPSTCRNASPTFAPPQIASHTVRAIRVYDDTGNVIGTHEHRGDFKELSSLDPEEFWKLVAEPQGPAEDRLSGLPAMECRRRFRRR
jgi:hypothetical protein